MQRSRVSFPIHFYDCAFCFYREIVWVDSQCAIELRFLFSITPDGSVTKSGLEKRDNVARVELNSALEVSNALFPAPLKPLDGSHRREYVGIIWQASACNFQFSQSAVVIAVINAKPPPREVRFTCIRTKAICGLSHSFHCDQPRRCAHRTILDKAA